MKDNKNEDEFFKLLVNISASSESTLERLSTILRVFVKKYFENKDFSIPTNPYETAMNCIMRLEAMLYTVYELEQNVISLAEKMELLYYKDLVFKSLVVLTNVDFFVKVLKKTNLLEDANELLEKVKSEFISETTTFDYDFEREDKKGYESIKDRKFKDLKPIQYRRAREELVKEVKDEIEKESLSDLNTLSLTEPKIDVDVDQQKPKMRKQSSGDELNYLVIPGLSLDAEFRPLEALKRKIKERSKITEARPGKDGKKVLRTASGWEIPTDLLENLYKDL